jgi:hypothetical protein
MREGERERERQAQRGRWRRWWMERCAKRKKRRQTEMLIISVVVPCCVAAYLFRTLISSPSTPEECSEDSACFLHTLSVDWPYIRFGPPYFNGTPSLLWPSSGVNVLLKY